MSQIDHLVFMVHGIGPVCDLRFRSIVECGKFLLLLLRSCILNCLNLGLYILDSDKHVFKKKKSLMLRSSVLSWIFFLIIF